MNTGSTDVARDRWRYVIPHYELSEKLLPGHKASWDELVYFAGTFDGYVVFPEVPHFNRFGIASRARFAATGELPDGLTLLRSALHGEQRMDYWNEGIGPARETLRYIHALVERIRDLVTIGAHTAPPPDTDGGIRDKVMNAYDRLLTGYAAWGGWRYHGWTDYTDSKNYLGPVVWSEHDAGLRLAVELEKEWSGAVHMEFPVARYTRADFLPPEKYQRVDLAVGDLSSFVEDATAYERFRKQRHEAYFELKWFVKGFRGGRDALNRLAAVPFDLRKLEHHIKLGRCSVAAMVVLDDEGWFKQQSLEDWPEGVWRLYVGPSALVRRGLNECDGGWIPGAAGS